MIMKKSYKMIAKSFLGLVFATVSISATAQESKGSFSTGADVVSSYVWRGVPQDVTYPSGTPNIQPYASYTIGGLTLGAWGSSSFSGTVKEVDLYATYAFCSRLSATITDYNWTFGQSYFNYKKTTDHFFEGTLCYTGSESFPICASVNTMFYGADKKDSTGVDNAYSTYVELSYPITSNAKLFVGSSLFDSPKVYGNTGFSVINVSLKVSKSIEITDKFSLPVYGVVGVNPQSKGAFFVAGITL